MWQYNLSLFTAVEIYNVVFNVNKFLKLETILSLPLDCYKTNLK